MTARRIRRVMLRSDAFSFCWSAVGSVLLWSRLFTFVLSGAGVGSCPAGPCALTSIELTPSALTRRTAPNIALIIFPDILESPPGFCGPCPMWEGAQQQYPPPTGPTRGTPFVQIGRAHV